jgi:hypothetical protein
MHPPRQRLPFAKFATKHSLDPSFILRVAHGRRSESSQLVLSPSPEDLLAVLSFVTILVPPDFECKLADSVILCMSDGRLWRISDGVVACVQRDLLRGRSETVDEVHESIEFLKIAFESGSLDRITHSRRVWPRKVFRSVVKFLLIVSIQKTRFTPHLQSDLTELKGPTGSHAYPIFNCELSSLKRGLPGSFCTWSTDLEINVFHEALQVGQNANIR